MQCNGSFNFYVENISVVNCQIELFTEMSSLGSQSNDCVNNSRTAVPTAELYSSLAMITSINRLQGQNRPWIFFLQ